MPDPDDDQKHTVENIPDSLYDTIEQAVQRGIAEEKRGQLETTTPQEAQEKHIETLKETKAYQTRQTYARVHSLFDEWAESEEIDCMNELSGSDLNEFKSWIKSNTGNGITSLNGILSFFKKFLEFCVNIDAVPPGLPGKLSIPRISDDEDVCEEKPDDEEVERMRAYLESHEPCSRRHVEFKLATEIPLRLGEIRAIDKEDVDLDKKVIKLKHRPEKEFEDEEDEPGTPLKNGTNGERQVNIPDELADLLSRYLGSPDRDDIEDKYGRNPLLVSNDDTRPTTKTIREDFYKVARPCDSGSGCKEECSDCRGDENNHASKCEHSYSPHPFRRWAIEDQIDKFVPKELISDRADVSIEVINKHYDTRSEKRKQEQRLKVLEKLLPGYGNPDATLDIDGVKERAVTESGELDPSALSKLEANGDDSIDTHAEDSGTGASVAQDQSTFDQFTEGPNSIAQPAGWLIMAGIVVGEWLPDRLQREVRDMTPATESSPWPGFDRAATGVAGYALFLTMLVIDFGFIMQGSGYSSLL